MANLTKNIVLQQIRSFKNSIFQFAHLPYADILTTTALQHIIEQSVCCRARIFTPLITLKAFIFQVLSTDGSCRQAVSHVLADRLSQAVPQMLSSRVPIVRPDSAYPQTSG